MFKYLGEWFSFRVAQYPVATVQVTVQFHVTYRGQAIEPGVGNGFHHLMEALLFDSFFQLAALVHHFFAESFSTDEVEFALLFDASRFLFRDAELRRPARYCFNEITAGFGGILFQVIGIHAALLVLVQSLAALFGQVVFLRRAAGRVRLGHFNQTIRERRFEVVL